MTTIKQFEKLIIDYLNNPTRYEHKKKAWQEFDKLRPTVQLDDLANICFIINDYPEKDHLLLKLTNDNQFFLKIGFYREYLEKLGKKDIHTLAKGIHSFFGQFNLANDDKEKTNEQNNKQ